MYTFKQIKRDNVGSVDFGCPLFISGKKKRTKTSVNQTITTSSFPTN